jgi:hypothetical protein
MPGSHEPPSSLQLVSHLSLLFRSSPLPLLLSHLPPPAVCSSTSPNPLDRLTPSSLTLLSYGALTPGRHIAVRLAFVCLLLERGADPDALSSRKRTFEDVVEVEYAGRNAKERDEMELFFDEVNWARSMKQEGKPYEIRTPFPHPSERVVYFD